MQDYVFSLVVRSTGRQRSGVLLAIAELLSFGAQKVRKDHSTLLNGITGIRIVDLEASDYTPQVVDIKSLHDGQTILSVDYRGKEEKRPAISG